MVRAPPYRRFVHPDGRLWEVRLNGKVVELRITTDGDTFERKRPFDAPVLGAADLDALVKGQLEDGFVETTPPDWKRRLDELVAYWDQDDPGMDADVLRMQLLEKGEATAKACIERLSWLEAGMPRDPAATRAWLRDHVDEVLPGILLALRYPDEQVLLHIDSLLAELKLPGVIEALLSIVEHPTADEPDGRPCHMPLESFVALSPPDADTAARLVKLLDSEDIRVRDVAAKVLAESSLDDDLFAALWKKRVVAKESEGMCWAFMRAAEVRRDFVLRDFLRWMQKQARFKEPLWADRVTHALVNLKNR
jgi:hypothetical protein